MTIFNLTLASAGAFPSQHTSRPSNTPRWEKPRKSCKKPHLCFHLLEPLFGQICAPCPCAARQQGHIGRLLHSAIASLQGQQLPACGTDVTGLRRCIWQIIYQWTSLLYYGFMDNILKRCIASKSSHQRANQLHKLSKQMLNKALLQSMNQWIMKGQVIHAWAYALIKAM